MTIRWAWVAIAVLAISLIAACGDDDDDDAPAEPTATSTAAPADDGSSNDGASDGDGLGGGDAVALGDFSVPLPEWADAVAQSDFGPIQTVQFIVPLDRQDATIAFYDDWTDAQADEYLRSEAESGGVTLQADVALGEEKLVIAILSAIEGDDFVAVTLSRGVLE